MSKMPYKNRGPGHFAGLLVFFATLCISTGAAISAEDKKEAEPGPARQAGPTLDRAQATKIAGDETLWYDIRELGVEGRGWTETKSYYDRLPAKAEGVVRDPVWKLSQNSAGMCVRFVTDATTISARWTLRSSSLSMPHMPATGVSGLDLYAKNDRGEWRWLGVGRPTQFPTNQQALANGLPKGEREYLLYLPLYNGVESVQLGISSQAALAKAPARTGETRPIVFYGTSITQGGCASRPGMTYAAILGRSLNAPAINLGFSGDGRMEPEVAQLLAELDPCVYVINCLPNMTAPEVAERVEPLVAILRKAHPQTPIILAEDRTYSNAWLLPSHQQRHQTSRAALRAAFDKLTAAGVPHLHYLKGDDQLGPEGDDTVDGSHPTDLGFLRMATALSGVLKPLVTGKKAGSQ